MLFDMSIASSHGTHERTIRAGRRSGPFAGGCRGARRRGAVLPRPARDAQPRRLSCGDGAAPPTPEAQPDRDADPGECPVCGGLVRSPSGDGADGGSPAGPCRERRGRGRPVRARDRVPGGLPAPCECRSVLSHERHRARRRSRRLPAGACGRVRLRRRPCAGAGPREIRHRLLFPGARGAPDARRGHGRSDRHRPRHRRRRHRLAGRYRARARFRPRALRRAGRARRELPHHRRHRRLHVVPGRPRVVASASARPRARSCPRSRSWPRTRP